MDMNAITAEISILQPATIPMMISKRDIVTAINNFDYSCCPSDNYNERSPPI